MIIDIEYSQRNLKIMDILDDGGYVNYFYYKNNNISSKHYFNKDDQLSREDDRPAAIFYYENGNVEKEYFYKKDKQHRFNKPAYIKYNKEGDVEDLEYWNNGVNITKIVERTDILKKNKRLIKIY